MMIRKNIDIGKLKVKYVLGIHSKIESYPDSEDIIYELIRDYCGRKATKLKFTNISIQKKYNLSDKKLSNIIDKLLKRNLIEELYNNSSYTTYQVIKNPYT